MGGVLVGAGGLAQQTGLVQTPSALNRWLEEAIILDADSIHDCIAALKPDILLVVDRQRDEELAERRERRKKQLEDEAARRKKEEDDAALNVGSFFLSVVHPFPYIFFLHLKMRLLLLFLAS